MVLYTSLGLYGLLPSQGLDSEMHMIQTTRVLGWEWRDPDFICTYMRTYKRDQE